MSENRRETKKPGIPVEFRDCPTCGYADAFHDMFRKANDGAGLKRYLNCPQCSSIFDIGLRATMD